MMKAEGDAGVINWLGSVAKENAGAKIMLPVVTAIVEEGVAKG